MLPKRFYESYKKSVINLKIIAKTKEDVITALTLAITGSILPHIAFASITTVSYTHLTLPTKRIV